MAHFTLGLRGRARHSVRAGHQHEASLSRRAPSDAPCPALPLPSCRGGSVTSGFECRERSGYARTTGAGVDAKKIVNRFGLSNYTQDSAAQYSGAQATSILQRLFSPWTERFVHPVARLALFRSQEAETLNLKLLANQGV